MNRKGSYFGSSSIASALWLVALGLAINAAVMVWTHFKSDSADASNVVMAAAMPELSESRHAGAVQVVPTQISATRWGVVLVNMRTHVMAVYRFVGSQSRIQLMASRDFQSDLQLKDFNNLPPTPAQVKAMVKAGKALTRP